MALRLEDWEFWPRRLGSVRVTARLAPFADTWSARLGASEPWIHPRRDLGSSLWSSYPLASSLTEKPFEIEVRLAGRRYRQEHASDRPLARVVVPAHGSLLALVSAATTAGRAGDFLLVLTPAEGQPGDPLVGRRASAADLSIPLPAVHPGRYAASLRYVPSAAESAAGREAEESVPRPVEVRANARVELRLGLSD